MSKNKISRILKLPSWQHWPYQIYLLQFPTHCWWLNGLHPFSALFSVLQCELHGLLSLSRSRDPLFVQLIVRCQPARLYHCWWLQLRNLRGGGGVEKFQGGLRFFREEFGIFREGFGIFREGLRFFREVLRFYRRDWIFFGRGWCFFGRGWDSFGRVEKC